MIESTVRYLGIEVDDAIPQRADVVGDGFLIADHDEVEARFCIRAPFNGRSWIARSEDNDRTGHYEAKATGILRVVGAASAEFQFDQKGMIGNYKAISIT